MQNCREVSYLIASDGLEHVGWPTRLQTRLHILFCKHCRRYAAEIATIGRIGREAWGAESVDTKQVQRLEISIMDYASGAHHGDREDTPDDEGAPTQS